MALTNHVFCPWMQLFDFLDFPYQFSLKQNFGDCFAKSIKNKTKMQEDWTKYHQIFPAFNVTLYILT